MNTARTYNMAGTFLFAALLAGAVLVIPTPAHAVPTTIRSSGQQSGVNSQILSESGAGPYITEDPFDFSGSPSLNSIGRIELTLSMWDGDTEVGDPDYNDLFVKLEGAEPSPRWYMNGLPNEGKGNQDDISPDDAVELTFSRDVTGDTALNSALLDSVGPGGDGRISVRLWDEDPLGNRVWLPSERDATLALTETPEGALPEPSTIALFLLAGAGAAATYVIRRG